MIVATLVPLGFVLARSHGAGYVDQLERDARTAAAALAARPDQSQIIVSSRYPPNSDVQAEVLDTRGTAATLPTDLSLFYPVASRAPEVRSALAGTADARTGTTSTGQRRIYVAVPVTRASKIDGALWLSSVPDPVQDLNRRTWAALGIIGAAAILFAVVVALAIARQIAYRLEVVAAGAERFAEGRFGEPIAVSGGDEVAQLGVRLNEMAHRIEAAVQRERDFAAAASHQLRTPLTAIKLRIEELRSTLKPRAGSTTGEYLDEMAQEVDRLTMLASGLLLLASIEGGGLPMEPLPAADAIEQAARRVRPLARQGGVELAVGPCGDGAAVAAPRGAFEEVIFNVLDNAVKFSPPGERVDVHAVVDDGRLVLSVGDRGPGITPEDAAHAFEPFFRSRRAGGVRGSGLGLTICARLCETAGASIALEPRTGGGTVAVIRWPLAEA